LPSHDKSDKFDTLSLDLYVDVVKQLIAELKYENVILCGHSLGGAVIQSFYFKYPNEVKALILVGTGARLRVNPMILDLTKNNYQEYLKSLPAGDFYRKTSPRLIEEYVKETSKVGSEVTYNDFNICDNFDTMTKTESINIPSLIVCGKHDHLTPVKYSQFFHQKIKDSELTVVENAGHMVMLEKPKEVNLAVENFLNNYF